MAMAIPLHFVKNSITQHTLTTNIIFLSLHFTSSTRVITKEKNYDRKTAESVVLLTLEIFRSFSPFHL